VVTFQSYISSRNKLIGYQYIEADPDIFEKEEALILVFKWRWGELFHPLNVISFFSISSDERREYCF
jgi:hypothetical protein